MTISQQKTILYFSPHQDDEILTMGINICNSVRSGQNVHVILCTDGSKCIVRKQLSDGRKCNKHAGAHTYTLTESELTAARDKEFRESCLALGVADGNIHILQDRFADRKLTISGSKSIIRQYLAAMGEDSIVCTPDPNLENGRQHRDHKALGYAAVELFNEGFIRELRLFTEPYYAERFRHKTDFIRGECKEVVDSASAPVRETIKKAVAAYSRWEPEAGRFAVGYHDMAGAFDALIKNGKSYYLVCIRNDAKAYGPESAGCGKKLIVSLASNTFRLSSTIQTLVAIYEQRVTPDTVLLWLFSSDFPGREKDLPEELIRMESENGLSVRWCEDNLELHDIYFRALREYPDALVITVDDTMIRHDQMTEKLYYSYLLHPQVVSAAMLVCAPVSPDLANMQRELNNIKNGWSFKIGRAITLLPRTIRGLLKR